MPKIAQKSPQVAAKRVCRSCDAKFEQFGRGRPRKYCFECKPPVGAVDRPGSAACLNCGCDFPIVQRRGAKPRYCSLRCCRQHSYEERMEALPPRPCMMCGGPILAGRDSAGRRIGQGKYCDDDCRKLAAWERDRSRRHARLGDKVARQCSHCGAGFMVDPKLPGGLVDTKRYCSVLCQRQGNRERRRARCKSLPNEPINRYKIFERDGWTCGLCGGHVDKAIKWPHRMSPSIDHIIPVVAGGPHTPDNVQCSHLGCNLDANAKGHPKVPLPKIRKVAS